MVDVSNDSDRGGHYSDYDHEIDCHNICCDRGVGCHIVESRTHSGFREAVGCSRNDDSHVAGPGASRAGCSKYVAGGFLDNAGIVLAATGYVTDDRPVPVWHLCLSPGVWLMQGR